MYFWILSRLHSLQRNFQKNGHEWDKLDFIQEIGLLDFSNDEYHMRKPGKLVFFKGQGRENKPHHVLKQFH